MSSMWYTAKDVMLLLDIGESTAYKVMAKLSNEITKKKVPGTDHNFAKPPRGKIQKIYFCEKYMLDRKECDEYLKAIKAEKAS